MAGGRVWELGQRYGNTGALRRVTEVLGVRGSYEVSGSGRESCGVPPGRNQSYGGLGSVEGLNLWWCWE